ncbi:conserved domain protein [Verrucomicrobiia bacterium DG1235]|nr:conserved domain protein [Verrucomicrobiae bacterium DG1235]
MPNSQYTTNITHVLKRLCGGDTPYTIKRLNLVILSSILFAVGLNTSFFGEVLKLYPFGWSQAVFHIALFLLLLCATILLLNILCVRFLTKPFLATLFIVCSLANYFMQTYGIVMNTEMLENIIQTSPSESVDLATPMLFFNLVVFGLLPSYLIIRIRIDYGSWKRALLSRVVVSATTLVVITASLFSSPPTFASFFREHKPVRYHANPIAFIYSVVKLASSSPVQINQEIRSIASDATIQSDSARKLIVLVVGETARADRFSLNGYEQETNPMLKQEDIINLTNVIAAGTSTAISVPSMFSHMGREEFSSSKARRTENLLDVLDRTGVSILWRDNNSDSKGVALRVEYQDFKDPNVNPINDGEPRDEGMLYGLQDYINEKEGDILIVLHQMGSHGPAYYKRYPKEFEVFTPVCTSSQLEKCSQEEIDNAYDNTILYTDYFLSKVIALLKENDEDFQTAMLYFSDHGESLGEGNMYLHGYPYSLAPIEQKHVPAILWFGSSFPVERDLLAKGASENYSHDNIFHTMLGLFEVQTTARNDTLDIVARNRAYITNEAMLANTNLIDKAKEKETTTIID